MYHPMISESTNMKLDVTIQRGVPMPGKRRVKIEKPWSDMQPGDSFFVPNPEDKTSPSDLRKWKHFLYQKAIRNWGSGNYYARSVTEEVDGVPREGVRVWRKPHEE